MTWCSMLCSFLGGVVFRRFDFFWKIQFLINFETLQIHSKRAEYEFHKKWKHDLYEQFPMEFKIFKLWKSSTWPKLDIIRRASVSTIEKCIIWKKSKIRGLILLGFPLCFDWFVTVFSLFWCYHANAIHIFTRVLLVFKRLTLFWLFFVVFLSLDVIMQMQSTFLLGFLLVF